MTWEAPDQQAVAERRRKRMQMVDDMSPALRACVHEYGLTVVVALTDCGVTKPNRIRHIVETILNEFSPTRGSYSNQGPRVQVEDGWMKDPAP